MARKPVFSIMDVENEKPEEKVDARAAPKELLVERQGNGLYAVRYSAGGEVPAILKGSYTSSALADRAIASLLTGRQNASAAD